MDTIYQIGLAIVAIMAIGGLSWWLAGIQTNREWARRERAEADAGEVRNKVIAVRRAYRGKYVPQALAAALDEGWETYSSLSQSTFYVRNEGGVQRIAERAHLAVQAIDAVLAHKLSAEELDAEIAAVNEQLAQAVQTTEQQIAELDTNYERDVAELARRRDGQKESVAEDLARTRERITAELAELEELKSQSVSELVAEARQLIPG